MKHEKGNQFTQIPKYLFLIGLIALPLVWWPWANVPYELPKVWLFHRWVEALSVTGLVSILFDFKKRLINKDLILLVLLFLIVAVISSLIGSDLIKSIWGNYYRGDGLFTLFHTVGLFLFVSLFWQKIWEKHTLLAMGFGSVVVSFWAIISGTPGATFGQPNFLAGYLLLTLPIQLVISDSGKTKSWRLLCLVTIFIQAVAVFLTGARAGVIGLAMILSWWIAKKLKKLRIFISVLGIIILALVTSYVVWQQRLYLHWSLRPVFIPESRERIIRSILRGVWNRPIFGWGWANADYAFEYNPWPLRFDSDVYVDKAHGIFLEVLATTGIVGFAVYVVIVLLATTRLRQTVWLMPMVIYLIHSQTNVISIAEESLFWMMLGIAAGRQSGKIDHGV